MSILSDKEYESMDWLSQAIEPYRSPISTILAQMPDEAVVPYDFVIKHVSRYNQITADDAIREFYKATPEFESLNFYELDVLRKMFKLVATPNVVINPATETIEGEIRLVKISNQIDDHLIKKTMDNASWIRLDHRDMISGAVVDLGLLLFDNNKEMLESFIASNLKTKREIVRRFVNESAMQDHFRIRCVKAYSTFINTIELYLSTNNQSALGEIYRVVTIARRGQAIYTVKEIKE